MSYAELERRANDQVEELLDAFAEARLAPTGPVLARIRANVMAHAAAMAATTRATPEAAQAPAPQVAAAQPRFGWLQVSLTRRAISFGVAASLTMGTTAAVLAAPPGSPFYNARLVIETALMPSVADIDARLTAYEEQLSDRIVEAEAAIAAGDEGALVAALAAYQDEVNRAVAELGSDPSRLARFEAVLAKHIAKLEALAARLPTQVARSNALQHAITASERAVARLQDRATKGGNGSTGNGGNSGTGPGTGNPGNTGNGGNGGTGPGTGNTGNTGNGQTDGEDGEDRDGDGPGSTTDPGDDGDDGGEGDVDEKSSQPHGSGAR